MCGIGIAPVRDGSKCAEDIHSREKEHAMRVREVMTRELRTIPDTATLTEAAKSMRAADIGALPVMHESAMVGMITDRDIVVRAIAENKDPVREKIKDYITPMVYQVSENASLQDAAQIMEEHQINRLIVSDKNNRPVGIISLADLAECHEAGLISEVVEKTKTSH
jgi:CBS domain-containing protein